MTATGAVDIKVNVLGEMQLARRLQGRIRASSDLSPAFERIADNFFATQKSIFGTEGSFEGNPRWEALTPAYAEQKARTHPGAKILTRSGKLERALTGGSGAIREVEPLRLAVGGSVIVGNWDLGSLHQTGTRKMKARKVINLTRRFRHRVMKELAEHFRREGRD